ncbi:Exportin-2 [Chamberlinius hualienensis]
MEITDRNLQTLSSYLLQTLSPDISVRGPAEQFLVSVEANKGYPILLLTLVGKNDVDLTIRISGAINFKNYVKRNWKVTEDDVNKIEDGDRNAIKEFIVDLMLQSPKEIQKQLSDAVSIIGREDFPSKWPNLLDNMINKFQSGDFNVINGVLHTAHSLFKRYRYEFKSQVLWTEVKFVLDGFAKPLTDLLNATMELVTIHLNNAEALKVIFSSLVLIAKIFHSLNCQDLPEFFEDNMATWMKHFLTLLGFKSDLLITPDNEEAGLLELLKSQICDNIAMYALKYQEEFHTYLPDFVTSVWDLLISIGPQMKYDLLVSNAIQFLASVAENSHYKHLFESNNVLGSICEKVILPNMEFRDSDEELFEDNPEEYIRRDIEGSDADTRRRAACDLVKALSKCFEAQITAVFSQYIGTMLESYGKNPTQNWRHKNVAVYLVTSLVGKAKTEKHGITKTNVFVSVVDFFQKYMLVELQAPNVNELPVLKADAIRYVMIFRNQLPRDVLILTFPHLIRMLTAQNHVVHTYAAHCIEKLLLLRLPDGTASFKTNDIQELAQPLLNNLFDVFNFPGSTENEYVMKAIMRVFTSLQEAVVPFLSTLLPKLTTILATVCKNPSKPHFNHYLFETLTISVQITCKQVPAAVSSFEEVLFPIFQGILQEDVLEFIPYVFQVLRVLLEFHEAPVPSPYMALFQRLLAPPLWERPGNIHPLVGLLQVYIEKGANEIASGNFLNALLGIFQKLISMKSYDHEGFYLLTTIIEKLPSNHVVQYIPEVFRLLFTRLQNSKTTKYIKSLLIFFCTYAIKFGISNLIQICDQIQPKLFGMVIERLFILEVQKVSGSLERKICAVGITSMLCEADQLIKGDYAHHWVPLLQALIDLLELPEDESLPDDEHFIEIEDTPGYQTAYSQLNSARKKDLDPCVQISNLRVHLAQSLSKVSVANPGRIQTIYANLAPNSLTFLQKYMEAANVSLA